MHILAVIDAYDTASDRPTAGHKKPWTSSGRKGAAVYTIADIQLSILEQEETRKYKTKFDFIERGTVIMFAALAAAFFGVLRGGRFSNLTKVRLVSLAFLSVAMDASLILIKRFGARLMAFYPSAYNIPCCFVYLVQPPSAIQLGYCPGMLSQRPGYPAEQGLHAPG